MDKIFKILQIINTIPMVIAQVEQVGKKLSGGEKKEQVEATVMAALETSEFVTGRQITDPKKFRKELKKTVDGIVGMLNVSVWKAKA